MDRLIYKYTSLDNAKKIIVGRTLKFTNPSEFNDPFDCNIDRLTFDLSTTDNEFDIHHESMRINALKAHGERVNNVSWHQVYAGVQRRKIERSRLCCFSLTNSHPLLWAHYGDKHNGACLVFDNSIKDRFVDQSLKIGIEGPVEYKKFEKVNYCSGRAEALRNLFMVKGVDWQYEQEYRIVGFDILEKYIEFYPAFLVGVIFGMKVSNQVIDDFKKELGVDFEHLRFDVAIKENEDLHILKWPGLTLSKEIQIAVLTQDPAVQGVLQRFFDR